jgi:[acyl-carrier-protein] S-malonyltransferase
MRKKIALIFPGQGSQSVGMGHTLAQRYKTVKDTFAYADELLGIHLSRIAWEGPETELNDTINTQPALFVHSFAVLNALKEEFPDLSGKFVAGHSMGELSALTAAGSLSFEDGLNLVRTRGKLMKQAGERSPGGMAAILGLDIPLLEQICDEISIGDDVVQVANDNCPGQVVLSGSRAALERSLLLAQERGAKRVIPLAVSIAAHSPLMHFAQEEFNKAVFLTPLSPPTVPVIGNVNALPLSTIDDIRDDLRAQLTDRVRWTESIEYMVSKGVQIFMEIGSGNVLSGLAKRISRETINFSVGEPDDFDNLENLLT